ncbi:hypothetical protein BH10BAC2_BH10BAC2_14970 [soil metagenome]
MKLRIFIILTVLFTTFESNWYDMPGNAPINPLLRTMIKISIDESEKANMHTNQEQL